MPARSMLIPVPRGLAAVVAGVAAAWCVHASAVAQEQPAAPEQPAALEQPAPAAAGPTEIESRILAGQAEILRNQEELKKKYDEIDRLNEEVAALKAAGAGVGTMKFKPSVYLRIRPDFCHNTRALGAAKASTIPGRSAEYVDEDSFYVGSRLMLGFSFEPAPGFEAVVTIQDSRKWGEETNFRTNGNGSLDIFAAYFEFRDIGGTGLTFRAGRFTMDYGSTIHVNSGSSGSTGQVYDGARLVWYRPGAVKIDAFTTLVKSGLGPIFSTDTKEDYESFSGLYIATDRPVEWMDAELYGFYQDDAFANFEMKLGTVGGRVIFRPVKGLKLSGEAAVQFGRVSSWTQDAVLQTSSHLASIFLADAMYEFHFAPARPLLGVSFLYASGDSNPWDRESHAFRPAFGSTHNFLGFMDVFRAGGIWDIAPTFRLKPVDGLDIWLDYHIFSQTADGGLYQHFNTFTGNGTRNGAWTMDRGLLIPAGNGLFIGHEFDLTVFWHPFNWMEVALGYCVFFPGPALDGAKIQGVTHSNGGPDTWVEEATLGGLTAHRFLVWTTFSY